MSRCECCRRDIAEPVIVTIAGPFYPGWGMCRSCWHRIGQRLRNSIGRARVAFKLQPQLEESVALYWLWQLAVSEAQFNKRRSAA